MEFLFIVGQIYKKSGKILHFFRLIVIFGILCKMIILTISFWVYVFTLNSIQIFIMIKKQSKVYLNVNITRLHQESPQKLWHLINYAASFKWALRRSKILKNLLEDKYNILTPRKYSKFRNSINFPSFIEISFWNCFNRCAILLLHCEILVSEMMLKLIVVQFWFPIWDLNWS